MNRVTTENIGNYKERQAKEQFNYTKTAGTTSTQVYWGRQFR